MLEKAKHLISRFGFSFFCLIALISFVQLLFQESSGHFDIFRSSAQILWRGQNPYGIEYPSAYYLYSPFCGMTLYGLFSMLSYKVDLGLYMGVSLLAFVWGCESLCKTFKIERGSFARGLFYILLSSEIVGGILSAKLEIIQAGLLMGLSSILISTKRPFWAAFCLGLLANWKFQLIPPVGLLLTGLFVREQRFTPPLAFLLGLAAAFAFPLLRFSPQELGNMHSIWQETLHSFMYLDANWLGFQHLYQSIRGIFSYSITLENAMITNISIGALLAGLMVIWGLRLNLHKKEVLLISLALGTAYVCCFSPLSQSGAYLVYAPLLLGSVFLIKHNWGESKKRSLSALLLCYYMVSIAYSDMTPKLAREFFKTFSLKAIGVLGLSILFVHLFYRIRRKRPISFSS